MKANILIIDDSLPNLRLLANLLQARGYKVHGILKAEKAISTACLAKPDLILLDIKMPGLDGYEVCQQLKLDEQTANIPIIFISALSEVLDKVKAFAVGGLDYITKPFQAEEVLARVENQLKVQFLTQQLIEKNAQLSQEIVKSQQLQAELSNQNRIKQSILNSAQTGICLTDENGVFIEVNYAYCQLYGFRVEELIGKAFTVHFPDATEEEKLVLIQEYQNFIHNVGNYDKGEFSVQRKDGVKLVVDVRRTRFQQDDGQCFVVTTVMDITERKQMEEKLRASETNLASAQRISHLGNWEFDVVTQQFLGSEELFRILGLEPTQPELNYIQFLRLVYPDDLPLLQRSFKQMLTKGRADELDYRIVRPDGKIRHLLGKGEVICDEFGQVKKLFGTAMDITQRKRVEEAVRQASTREREKTKQLELTLAQLKQTQAQLIQTEKMSSLGQMVAGIAHEINNPVSFIYGNLSPANEYANALIRLIHLYQNTYPQSTSEIKQFIEEIDLEFIIEDWYKLIQSMQVGAERIQEIVLSLRRFSRLNESNLKSVDIHEGIDNTLIILQHRLRGVGERPEIAVVKKFSQLPSVTCYASQLNQVFMNLLSNAIDAVENQSAPRIITISTSVEKETWEREINETEGITAQDDGMNLYCFSSSKCSQSLVSPPQYVMVRIADNGMGMNEAVRHQIFDPFFTTKPVGSGTGLGLAISYQIIVEKHQGKLCCISAPGKGTEMILQIPINPLAL
jgi:PAS domain S-box-containing protein